MSEHTPASEDDVVKAKELLGGILERMGFDAEVEASEEDAKVSLEVVCEEEEDTQRIIGRHGQVIDSLQHLVSKMLQRGREERGPAVIVDTGGYRERHIERLESLAARMADKVLSSGRAVDLSPMSAFDRRIVHLALKDIDGIETHSEGEGRDRHIVVEPA